MKEFVIDLKNTALWDPDARPKDPIPERFAREELGCIRLNARDDKPSDWLLDGTDVELAEGICLSGRVYDVDAWVLSVCPSDSSDPLAIRAGWLVPEHDTPRWRKHVKKRLTKVVRPDGDVYWTLKAREPDDTDTDKETVSDPDVTGDMQEIQVRT